ncbi:MAG TPA: hypothetical protein PLD12_05255 [Bacteroidales bacterium]|nr:hypothetical protein [Bacteroidales bacterium]HOK98526.1 hypothetical protein [Bacteroidales bacterium]HPO65501.1 hypothetical protein [Bacteroidales bacterium]
MKKHLFYSLGSILMLALISNTSCQKDNTTPANSDELAYTKEIDQVDSYLDEIGNEVDEISYSATSQSYGSDSMIDQGSKGRRIRFTHRFENGRVDTIIYENFVNGRSQFKRSKNGMIIITQTGGPLQDTFTRTITFNKFNINGNQIEGTKTITKTATYTFTITFEGKITFKDGTTHTRSFTRTRTWIAGYDTPFNVWDDEYSIEGSAQGTNRRGISYTSTITSPLIIKTSCPYIVAGTIELVVGANANTITINYGDENSDCDANATVTVNGEVNQIQLDAEE